MIEEQRMGLQERVVCIHECSIMKAKDPVLDQTLKSGCEISLSVCRLDLN